MAEIQTKEQKLKALQSVLKNYYHGDMSKVKRLAKECREIGFPIGDNIDTIMRHNEQFLVFITYSDFGILGKLTEAMVALKGK